MIYMQTEHYYNYMHGYAPQHIPPPQFADNLSMLGSHFPSTQVEVILLWLLAPSDPHSIAMTEPSSAGAV